MPSNSGVQHRAMAAAASGNSTLGIPADVGSEFMQADKGHHFGSMAKSLQHHGAAQGSGEHKRHPSTSGYKQTLAPRKRRHV